jgi:hypothetical protein
MILPFDEWRPDTAPLSPGLEVALGVLPAADGYDPMPMPVFRGPSGLPGRASWVMVVISGDGVSIPIAFTSSGIYRPTASAWEDIGRTELRYASSFNWRAVQWGDTVYAINGLDTIQYYTIGGSNFTFVADQQDHLTSRYIAVVGDFLVLGYILQNGLNEQYPSRVQWSGRGRPSSFTPDIVIQSGFSDRAAIGRVQGLTGGEFGLILGEEGLDRMDYTGPPYIWQFRTLETDIGCEIPRSVVQAGSRTAWWSRRGWRISDGGPSQPIGLGKVDKWFRGRMDFDRAELMTSAPLLREGAFVWAYCSRDNVDGRPDEALAYSWDHNRWTYGKMSVDCLGRMSVPSRFTDDAGLSALLGPTTDDSALMTDSAAGTRPFAAAIRNGSLYVMQAANGTSVQLTTTETNLIPGARARVSRARPLVHGATDDTWLYVETREDQRSQGVRRKGPIQPESDGSFALHSVGRYHRFRWHGRVPFTRAQGIEVPDWAIKGAGTR